MSLVLGIPGSSIRFSLLFNLFLVLINAQDFSTCSGTLVIDNTNYEDSLSSCKSWEGSFTVNLYPNSYSLDSLTSLTQDLQIICNTEAPGASASTKTTLSMPKLRTISGGITIKNCPNTLSLNFPALRNYTDLTLDEVDDITDQLNSPSSPIYDAMTGSLVVNLCNLTSIVRTAGGSLGGFNAQMSQQLTNVTMNSIDSITGSLTVENCPGISLNFANVSSLSSAKLRQIASIDMSMLKNVNGDFQFDSNDDLEGLVLKKLTTVGSGNSGDFMITNNPNLSHIDVRHLKSVDGTLTLSNDGALGDLSSFGRVQNVGKDLTLLNSPIYAVNLGNVSGVGGQFELSPTYAGLTCENFSKFKQQVSLNRPLLCGNYTKIEDLPGTTTGNPSNSPSSSGNDRSSASSPTSSSTTTTTATSNPNASPSTSPGTIAGIVVSTVLALTLVALVSVLIWRRRKARQKKDALEAVATPTESTRSPLFELKEDAMHPELSNDGQRHEMLSTSHNQVYEMPHEIEVYEMPAEPVEVASMLR